MPAQPEVSVVVPVLDRAEHVTEAIGSVLEQTHAPSEVLVVDGGSTDGTRARVRSIEDERVRLRKQTSEGLSAARNEAIEHATGQLVAFLDADDTWRTTKLERQIAALADQPDPAGASLTGLTKREGEPRTRSGASGWVHEAVRRMQVPTYTSTLLVRREALAEVGGFDEQLACFEDWELCLRLSQRWRFAFVDEPLVAKGHDGANVSAEPGRLAEAIERLREGYELPDATLARLLTDLGRTSLEAGRAREAREPLAASLRRDPLQPVAALAWLTSRIGSQRAYEAAMSAVYRLQRMLSRARPDDVRPRG